ncbi:hypothetical protein SNOG_09647 [Parastagonospora nodorum SN15]|uniref:Uncharacterized protein n=1 Tax=Phaeosphaeria nodorum (strain SN15 / ATCC MYA-4574 / FGSC 10173) TaxID=321614 RepID=Q0UF17_PHANO|nr:hypothetical protein SNOG_09647 [Parastagonospora nodorum SN15]EAT82912.1 hypothetical protein SNOG_09647 [Parastagonospora nodorum SN15]
MPLREPKAIAKRRASTMLEKVANSSSRVGVLRARVETQG